MKVGGECSHHCTIAAPQIFSSESKETCAPFGFALQHCVIGHHKINTILDHFQFTQTNGLSGLVAWCKSGFEGEMKASLFVFDMQICM